MDLAAGHSYGTNLLFSAMLSGFRPRVMVLQAPFFLFGANGNEAGQRGDFTSHVQQMVSALPLTFRFDSEQTWMDFFVHNRQVHPPRDKVLPSDRPTKLICVVGEQDGDIDAEKSLEFIERAATAYSQVFELVDYLVVPGGGHDQSSLMTAEFVRVVGSNLR